MQLLLCGYMRASKGYPNMEVLMKVHTCKQTSAHLVYLASVVCL
jgi:hypothetical protein